MLSGHLHLWKPSNKKSGVYIRFIPLAQICSSTKLLFQSTHQKRYESSPQCSWVQSGQEKKTPGCWHIFPSLLRWSWRWPSWSSAQGLQSGCPGGYRMWLFFATICVLKSGISQFMAIIVGTRMIHWYTIKFLGKAIFRQTRSNIFKQHNFQESSGCS